MRLVTFSYLIIVLNFLFFVIGFTSNIVIVGSYLGFLAAIGTDPIIIFYAIIIGAGLVNYQSRFSILYFILAAVVGAAASHYFIGTKMFIIDVVRFDALLIMPALIVIVASFFTPKSKDSTKKVSIKKVKVKHGAKVNKDFNKGIRSTLLIIIISAGTFLLVIPNSRESLVGENVTQSLLQPFFTTSRIQQCTYQLRPNAILKIPGFDCNTIDWDSFITKHNLVKNTPQLDKWFRYRTMLLPEVPLREEGQMYGTDRVRQIGTFYLQKKYRFNDRKVSKIINILHPILLIVLIFYTWRLRFCITGITVSIFKKIKAAI